MKKMILPLAIVAMAALLGAAAAWDCVRLASSARYRVTLADEEMQKHERRLVKLLNDSPNTSPDVRSAVASYESADKREARDEAYERVVAQIRGRTDDKIDAASPLDRKFMDDVAGAINRREIAQRPYEEELAAYQRFLGSFRGSVARLFSPRARGDWQSIRQ